MKFSTGLAAATLASAFIIMGTTTASASVGLDALSLGGVGYGSSASYVRSIYGSPREIEREHESGYNGVLTEYEYGDSVSIYFDKGIAKHVKVSANNGWSTPAGVAVGMDASVLRKVYGEPDYVQGDEYIYRVNGNKNLTLVFEIENNRIDEIEAGWRLD